MRSSTYSFLRCLPVTAALFAGSLSGVGCSSHDVGLDGTSKGAPASTETVACERCNAEYRVASRTFGNGPPVYYLQQVTPAPTASTPDGGMYMMDAAAGHACPACGAAFPTRKRFPWEKA